MRLAPFYDLVSTEIYGNKFRKKFAFSISGENSANKMSKKHIYKLEQSLEIREGVLLNRFHNLSEKILNEFSEVKKELLCQLPKCAAAERIYEVVKSRCKHIERFM